MNTFNVSFWSNTKCRGLISEMKGNVCVCWYVTSVRWAVQRDKSNTIRNLILFFFSTVRELKRKSQTENRREFKMQAHTPGASYSWWNYCILKIQIHPALNKNMNQFFLNVKNSPPQTVKSSAAAGAAAASSDAILHIALFHFFFKPNHCQCGRTVKTQNTTWWSQPKCLTFCSTVF